VGEYEGDKKRMNCLAAFVWKGCFFFFSSCYPVFEDELPVKQAIKVPGFIGFSVSIYKIPVFI